MQDKSGTAYLVRSIGSAVNDHIGVSRLSPDYLDTRRALACPLCRLPQSRIPSIVNGIWTMPWSSQEGLRGY